MKKFLLDIMYTIVYNINKIKAGKIVMILQQHEVFSKWLRKQTADVQTAVFIRLTRVADGNIGDSKSVGDGVFEIRIFHRPGYRIYYVMRGEEIIILLCTGDKSSQKSDIAKAKQLAKEV